MCGEDYRMDVELIQPDCKAVLGAFDTTFGSLEGLVSLWMEELFVEYRAVERQLMPGQNWRYWR